MGEGRRGGDDRSVGGDVRGGEKKRVDVGANYDHYGDDCPQSHDSSDNPQLGEADSDLTRIQLNWYGS